MSLDLFLGETDTSWSRGKSNPTTSGYNGHWKFIRGDVSDSESLSFTESEKSMLARLAATRSRADAGDQGAKKKLALLTLHVASLRARAGKGDAEAKRALLVLRESGIFNPMQKLDVSGSLFKDEPRAKEHRAERWEDEVNKVSAPDQIENLAKLIAFNPEYKQHTVDLAGKGNTTARKILDASEKYAAGTTSSTPLPKLVRGRVSDPKVAKSSGDDIAPFRPLSPPLREIGESLSRKLEQAAKLTHIQVPEYARLQDGTEEVGVSVFSPRHDDPAYADTIDSQRLLITFVKSPKGFTMTSELRRWGSVKTTLISSRVATVDSTADAVRQATTIIKKFLKVWPETASASANISGSFVGEDERLMKLREALNRLNRKSPKTDDDRRTIEAITERLTRLEAMSGVCGAQSFVGRRHHRPTQAERQQRLASLKARAAAGDQAAVARLQKIQSNLTAELSTLNSPQAATTPTTAPPVIPGTTPTVPGAPPAIPPYGTTNYPTTYPPGYPTSYPQNYPAYQPQYAYQSPYYDPSTMDPYGPAPQPTVDVYQGSSTLSDSSLGEEETALACEAGGAERAALARSGRMGRSQVRGAFVGGLAIPQPGLPGHDPEVRPQARGRSEPVDQGRVPRQGGGRQGHGQGRRRPLHAGSPTRPPNNLGGPMSSRKQNLLGLLIDTALEQADDDPMFDNREIDRPPRARRRRHLRRHRGGRRLRGPARRPLPRRGRGRGRDHAPALGRRGRHPRRDSGSQGTHPRRRRRTGGLRHQALPRGLQGDGRRPRRRRLRRDERQ